MVMLFLLNDMIIMNFIYYELIGNDYYVKMH